jgi:hypothetical protein
VRYDWQHYMPLIERKPGALRNGAPFADMPEPLQRLRGLLLKREGGDRIMAKVLAAVPKAGLEAVLVAVELVLESGNPSAEHVENVLNRLKRPRPGAVETALPSSRGPAGRHRPLRPPAPGGEPCVTSPPNSRPAPVRHGRRLGRVLPPRGGGASLQTSRWLIEHLLQAEHTDRGMRSVRYQMHAARFPVHRDLAGFDFEQSKVDRADR